MNFLFFSWACCYDYLAVSLETHYLFFVLQVLENGSLNYC